MSGNRPGRNRSPQRTPHGNRRPAVVRRCGRGQFELVLSPGASIPDLVAAAGTLPRQVLYTEHRRPAPGDGANAAVLVFQPPPPEPTGAPVRPSPGGKPSPVADTAPVRPGWVPDVGATVRAGGALSVLEEMLAALLTPAAFDLHGHLLVHLLVRGLAHCDPEALLEAAELARRRRVAHRSTPEAA